MMMQHSGGRIKGKMIEETIGYIYFTSATLSDSSRIFSQPRVLILHIAEKTITDSFLTIPSKSMHH